MIHILLPTFFNFLHTPDLPHHMSYSQNHGPKKLALSSGELTGDKSKKFFPQEFLDQPILLSAKDYTWKNRWYILTPGLIWKRKKFFHISLSFSTVGCSLISDGQISELSANWSAEKRQSNIFLLKVNNLSKAIQSIWDFFGSFKLESRWPSLYVPYEFSSCKFSISWIQFVLYERYVYLVILNFYFHLYEVCIPKRSWFRVNS